MQTIPSSRLKYLFIRYFENNCTKDEREELLQLVAQAQHDKQLCSLMDEAWEHISADYKMDEQRGADRLSAIFAHPAKSKPKRRVIHLLKWPAAAVFLLAIATVWYWNNQRNSDPSTAPPAALANNTAGVAKSPVLILGNGQRVVLDSSNNNIVVKQGNVSISNNNQRLTYRYKIPPEGPPTYNTIITPKGLNYSVILPDGSKVWLNAASSLKFPTSFTGSKRQVKLNGEAYFEISTDRDRPFQVKVNDLEVKVLGTHFNIMAYKDEPQIKTTLLKGAVQVTKGNNKIMLSPGQQAITTHSTNEDIMIKHADLEEVVAWKDGLFVFHNTSLKAVLRNVARWYDIQPVYKGQVSARLNGMISKKASLSQVLDMLKVTSNIQFKIQGRNVIVLPGKQT